MQRALSAGWSAVGQPLVADYVDRLVAELGTPPDPAKARRAGAAPAAVGPHRRAAGAARHAPAAQRPARHRGTSTPTRATPTGVLARSSADGHRIVFGLGERRPGSAGRAASAGSRWRVLLCCTAAGLRLRAAAVPAAGRHPRRRAALRQRRFRARRSRSAAPTSWATWRRRSTRWPPTCTRMLDAQARAAAGDQPRAAFAADTCAAERRAGGRRPGARRAAARPGGDARPDHRPAGKRTPGRPARRAAARARAT